ncbi:MAG: Gfo/Idh/MocA family oxidoreductase [Aureliella sp.]
MHPRRDFVYASAALSAAATAALTSSKAQAQTETNDRPVRVGVMGLSRGQALATGFNNLDGVEVAWVCDVDGSRLSNSVKQLQEQGGGKGAPQTTKDFRDMLADPQVDALVCAAPNHWHAPATIMACKAGKHVYVEKPCSHNPREGEWMVAAAKQFDRCVQMGTQRRSAPGTQAAISKLHSGAIGKVHLARCYYIGLRGPIGHGAEAQPPAELDYDLWQGPAPHVPYRDNILPYNWHWFWHWGGGELANNGVHGLDLCRWGLDVDFPVRTVSSGGRYWYDDDQQTPDVQSACFEFEDGKQATWSALSCNKHGPGYFCAFFGDDGSLELDSNGLYRIFDRNDKQIDAGDQASVGDVEHLQNFIDAVRADDPSRLNQPIIEGHKSTLLCHLGNIAYRTGGTVQTDSKTGRLLGDVPEQLALWQRDYDPNWVEAVSM